MNHKILIPSSPKVIYEDKQKGIYEIDNLYPGFGHTLGNSLRRIVHSAVPGVAITSLSIDGVAHEFSTIDGVYEDVITIILNLKRVNFSMLGDEPQTVSIDIKGEKVVTAKDIKCPSQITVINTDAHIATLTTKSANLSIEMTLEKGIGYASKESRNKNQKANIGSIILDADFTPIRRVKYEVENMRVGERTDYNKLRMTIETDGSITPKEVFIISIETMLAQLSAMKDFSGNSSKIIDLDISHSINHKEEITDIGEDSNTKVKVDDLPLSARTVNALLMAGVKSVAGLVRKSEEDILGIEGIGEKGLAEIKEALSNLNLELKPKK